MDNPIILFFYKMIFNVFGAYCLPPHCHLKLSSIGANARLCSYSISVKALVT